LTAPPEPATAPIRILGLDGLRAVSVLAVLAYHAQFDWMRGGFLGVEVFFVISGFLITGLLVKECEKTGAIDLRRFWKSRLLRLLPALLALLLAVGLYGILFMGEGASQFRMDLAASFLYGENWHLIHSGGSYFADQGFPLLRHLWSLAVEGQFYLAWPFLVAACIRVTGRRAGGRTGPLALLTAALALASLGWMLHLADPDNVSSVKALASLNRVYLGTDTRAFGLLAGALLALGLPALRLRAAQAKILDGAGFLALAALAVIFVKVDIQLPLLYRGGFLVVDALTAVIIAGLLLPSQSRISTALGWAPLEWLGQRSYGIYLWHWPVFRLVAPGKDGWEALGLRVLLTMVLTEASFRLVELPLRKGPVRRWFTRPSGTQVSWSWRLRRLAVVGAVVGVTVGESLCLARRAPYVDPVAESIRAGAAALDGAPSLARVPGLDRAPVAPDPTPWVPARAIQLPPDLQGVRLTAIGDSVMKGAAPALKRLGEATLGEGQIQINAEESRPFHSALEILDGYRKEQDLGEIVVVHLGTNNSSIPEGQFRKMMALLADRRLVLILTVKSDKTKACDAVNGALGTLVASYPNARIYDWSAAASTHPEFFYADQTHLRPEGARFYAEMILTQIALLPGEAQGTQARLR
jgi:peptidoglycan/LPS O-acetylase OafA/YrhL